MAGRCNPNRAKIHRSYTVEEIACLYSIHKNTVRSWVKAGLPVCDHQKPMLILGFELRGFIQDKNSKRKQKCQPYEMYCLRCKSPQKPAENMIDYEPINDLTGRMIGICSSCECIINKYISLAGFLKIQQNFTDSTKTYKQVGLPSLKQ